MDNSSNLNHDSASIRSTDILEAEVSYLKTLLDLSNRRIASSQEYYERKVEELQRQQREEKAMLMSQWNSERGALETAWQSNEAVLKRALDSALRDKGKRREANKQMDAATIAQQSMRFSFVRFTGHVS